MSDALEAAHERIAFLEGQVARVQSLIDDGEAGRRLAHAYAGALMEEKDELEALRQEVQDQRQAHGSFDARAVELERMARAFYDYSSKTEPPP